MANHRRELTYGHISKDPWLQVLFQYYHNGTGPSSHYTPMIISKTG